MFMQTRSAMRVIGWLVVAAALPCAVLVQQSPAAQPQKPKVKVTVDTAFDQATGLWTYTYTVETKHNSPTAVRSLTLLGVAQTCDMTSPSSGWWKAPEWRGTDAVQWRAKPTATEWTSPHSVQIGSTQTGFIFRSFASPGEVAYVCEADLPPVEWVDEDEAIADFLAAGGYDQVFQFENATKGTIDGPVGIVSSPCPEPPPGGSGAETSALLLEIGERDSSLRRIFLIPDAVATDSGTDQHPARMTLGSGADVIATVVGNAVQDPGTGLWTYQYIVKNAPASPRAIWSFSLEPVPAGVATTGPQGWSSDRTPDEVLLNWFATDTGPNPPENAGNVSPSPFDIAPGSSGTFTFISPLPPADSMLTFYVHGYHEIPSPVTPLDIINEMNSQLSFFEDSYMGQVIGPVSTVDVERPPAAASSRLSVPVPSRPTVKREVGLLAQLHSRFLRANESISRVRILDVRPNPCVSPGAGYAVIATGVAPRSGQSVDFQDELFGIFVVDSTLTRVTRVVDIFPTLRWLDYSVRFEGPEFELPVVVGAGQAHGDQRIRKEYDWCK